MKSLKRIVAGAATALATAAPLAALALVQQAPPQRTTPFTVGNILATVDALVTWLFFILIGLSVIFFTFAAFKYLTSGGDPEKVKSAHNMLIYGIVAIAVAIVARGLVFLANQLIL